MKEIKNVTIEKLDGHELDKFEALIKVFEEVFEMQNFSIPSRKHLQGVLEKDGFMVFVARWKGNVIGGLTAYKMDQYYSEKPLAYIFDLAVLRSFQRQGLGKQLIQAITEYCQENGFEEAYVQADKVDDHALDFYRSTPITTEEQVVHFSYTMENKHR
ncbi:GNAT family N-acetyltransferase [Rapidithrix thailandica]|uniref:GNAT family N-acetyltransferase n=1 Tax=Rapidithrix thailandica TaxID=413964 RepID=A0AAW9S399_9BACT